MGLLALFLSLFLPLVLFGLIVASINWVYDRIFDNEIDPEQEARRREVFQSQFRNFSPFRRRRESKATPHYDALVEKEWRASRLEDKTELEDSSEIHALSELMDSRDRK
jgi:hypothetical protein